MVLAVDRCLSVKSRYSSIETAGDFFWPVLLWRNYLKNKVTAVSEFCPKLNSFTTARRWSQCCRLSSTKVFARCDKLAIVGRTKLTVLAVAPFDRRPWPVPVSVTLCTVRCTRGSASRGYICDVIHVAYVVAKGRWNLSKPNYPPPPSDRRRLLQYSQHGWPIRHSAMNTPWHIESWSKAQLWSLRWFELLEQICFRRLNSCTWQ